MLLYKILQIETSNSTECIVEINGQIHFQGNTNSPAVALRLKNWSANSPARCLFCCLENRSVDRHLMYCVWKAASNGYPCLRNTISESVFLSTHNSKQQAAECHQNNHTSAERNCTHTDSSELTATAVASALLAGELNIVMGFGSGFYVKDKNRCPQDQENSSSPQ